MRTPSIDIEFGGESRKLIYDYNALAELQDLAGTYKSDMATMKAVRAALWAGLLAETLDKRGRETARTLSLIEVGDILSAMSAAEVESVVDAITQARELAEPPKADPTTATEKP